jgi:hypothetical protein
VKGALFRATTTSFGSICFGSLVVAIVQTIRDIVYSLRRNAQRRRERNSAMQFILCIMFD